VGGTAVAAVAFERLWQHTRRGSTQVLWQLLLEVNERRLAAVENAATAAGAAADSSTAATAAGASKAPARTRRQQQQQLAEAEQSTQQQQQQSGNGQQDDQAVVVSTAAYGVLLLAQAVHYFRGSRVEDYGPLIKTVDRLVNLLQQSPAAPAPAPAGEQQSQQQLLQLQWRQQHGGEITWSVEDLDGLTLSHSTLQLILGVTLGHTKEVGASQGLGFIKGPCSHWSRVLGLASVPQQDLVAFTQGLVMPPGNASITELFAPQLLGALGQLLLAAVGDDSGSGSNDKRKASAADCALAGLLEVCALLQPNAAFGSSSLPLLLTAHPGGADLAAAVAAMAAGCSSSVAAIGSSDSSSSSSSSSKQQLLQGWAALQLLPHAAVRLEQAVEVCSSVLTAATAAISHLQGAAGSSDSDVTVGELLQLRGMVLQMLAVLLPAVAPQQLPQLAANVLHWLLQQQQQQHGQPLDFATISSAAQVFEALRARVDQGMAGFSNSTDAAAADLASAQELLAVDKLPGVINITLTSLTAPQQELRAAALRLQCCFDQPSFTMPQQQQEQDSGAKASHERAAFEGMRCDVLCVLRDMHTQPCSIQAGRTWSVALDRITNHLEYGRVPLLLQPAVVGGLLGVLHIR
jgi:U3 small nucleolar RNA-associated protein 20